MKKFDFPFEKYKFYTNNKDIVVAISTYAGQEVRGIARCAPEDEFSLEKGKRLAAAKCNYKVAEKRQKSAEKARATSFWNFLEALQEMEYYSNYYRDADEALADAAEEIYELMKEL